MAEMDIGGEVDVEKDKRKNSYTGYGSTLPSDRVLTVVGFETDSKGVWNYSIEVTGSAGLLSSYGIKRRFNDFKQLYMAIKPIHDKLPDLPDHGLWSKMCYNDPKLLEERRVRFQEMLTNIQNCPIARYSKAFAAFLGEQPFSTSCTSGYISLDKYASYTDMNSEIQERRKRKESRSSLSAPTTTTTTTKEEESLISTTTAAAASPRATHTTTASTAA